MKRTTFFLVAAIVFAAAGSAALAEATVSTDQSDYPPGSTVQIFGSGFEPAETVQLQVINLTDLADTGEEHDPWTITADASGNITTTWYVTPDEANMTLRLTATGLSSGLTGQTTFTDAAKTWVGGTTGALNDWNTAGNWSPSGVPASGDSVTINTATYSPHLTTTATLGSLVVNGSLNIDSGGYLNVTANMNSGSGTIYVSGGTFTNVNTISASSLKITISSGKFSVGSINSLNTYTASGGLTEFTVGNFTITTFVCTGGTVEYDSNAGSQNVTAGNYYNVLLAGSAKKSFSAAATTITGNLSIVSGSGLASLANGLNATVNSLTLGGVIQATGTLGSVASGATNQNNTYFDNSQGGKLNVTAAAATKLVFTTQPASTTAGSTMANVVVQIADANGNAVSQGGTNITLTLNGSTLYSGTNPQTTDYTGKATFNNLVIQHAGTGLNFSAAGGSFTGATSSNFDITAATATQLVFIAVPATGTAGTAFSVTVQSQDAYGNPSNLGSATTITLSKASGGGTLSGTLTGSIGISANSVTIATPVYSKSDTLTLTGTTSGGVTLTAVTSGNIVFSAGAANKLAFSTSPGNGTGGSTFSTQPVVTVQDANGNSVTNDTSSVTLAIGANPGGGTLSGTKTVAAAAGVATFSGLSIDKAGTNYTLTATDGSLSSATSSTFNITVGSPVANPVTYYRAKNAALKISITNLIAQSTSDPQGNPLGLASMAGGLLTNNTVIATTTNGSSVYIANPYKGSAYIILTPTNNLNETFAYVVNDLTYPALLATNVITISVSNAVGQVTGSISTAGGGGVTTIWAGIPGSSYAVQRSTNLSTWTDLWTTNAPTAGMFNFTDAIPPQPTAYYRLRQN